MAKVSKGGKGKTLYIELSVFPCGLANTKSNLTISCPDKDTRFKTSLTDGGLKKFRNDIIRFYAEHVKK